MNSKKELFLNELQQLCNKYNASLEVTDDGKSWGMHVGIVEVHIPGEIMFELPKYIDPNT